MIKTSIILRRIISLAILVVFIFGLNDATKYLYEYLHIFQVGPLFLRALATAGLTSLALLGLMILSTFIFGRWYCSSLCPLGTFQDIIIGIRGLIKPYQHKGKKSSKFRVIIFIFVIIMLFLGFISHFSNVEPFSIFTRLIANVIFPVMNYLSTGVNNISIEPFLTAGISAIILTTIVIFRGRFFCNMFCPVGSMLGSISQYSSLGIKLHDNCKKCGACEKVCKADAIIFKDKFVDHSKCVMCLNCLKACKFKAISYGKIHPLNKDKRKLIKDGLVLGVFGVGALLSHKFVFNKKSNITKNLPAPMPPGVKSIDSLNAQCVSCHACVNSCPVGIIKIKDFTPELDFTKSYCQFECNICTHACPSHAIAPLSHDEKKRAKIGEADLDLDICVVRSKNEACGACAEHCPTGAVTMVPNEKNIPEPVLNKKLCIGCGACTYACPVTPKRAIIVTGLAYPRIAQQLEVLEDNIVKDNQEGFAF